MFNLLFNIVSQAFTWLFNLKKNELLIRNIFIIIILSF